MKVSGIRIAVLILIASLVLGIIGCNTSSVTPSSSTTPASTSETKTLKVGLATVLTGSGAAMGIDAQRAYELIADEINANGGLKVGADRYKIELVVYDNKYQATDTVAAVNKLIFQDGVKYVFTYGSSPSLATLPITQPNNIFHVMTGYASGLIGKDKPLSFRPQQTGKEACEGLYGYITTNMKEIKNVVCMGTDDDTGKGSVQSSIEIATTSGLNVVGKEYTARNTTDFYPIITRILPLNPDMIDTDSMTPGDVAILLKQARERGFKGLVITNSSMDIPTMNSIAGAAAEGFMGINIDYTSSTASPEQQKFAAAYIKKYGPPFGATVGQFVPYLQSIAAGIEAAQSIDPIKAAAALPDTTVDFLGDKCSWGGTQRYGINHQLAVPIFTSVIKDGKLYTLGKFTPPLP